MAPHSLSHKPDLPFSSHLLLFIGLGSLTRRAKKLLKQAYSQSHTIRQFASTLRVPIMYLHGNKISTLVCFCQAKALSSACLPACLPHLRMILDDSVFPAPDSPDTMIDWLAAFLPAPSRIWW